MSEDVFTWTPETVEKFFHLRLQNEWLFKKKKQPWHDFYNLLLENGFPKSLTLNQIRKKWQYTFDCYKEAKLRRNTLWLYYNLFDKYLGKNVTLDKYESWSDEWRLKLIQAYRACHVASDGKNIRNQQFWRAVEKELRSSGLPTECCIQDIQGLFHHFKMTFQRKCKVSWRKGESSVCWPLYTTMLELLETCEPESLRRMREDAPHPARSKPSQRWRYTNIDDTFVWNRDITESFIQIRLQHEWLFKEKKQPWDEFSKIMRENGYINLSTRAIRRKWSAVYGEYQKAVASNNTNWLYYNLFQLYLEENSYNLDPLQNWQERWVHELIRSRTRHHQLFNEFETPFLAWREVEKDLRELGIPMDHSLLDLQGLWKNLKKTFRWKSKFAAKGMLNEPWPYYDGMEKYFDAEGKEEVAATALTLKLNNVDIHDLDDGFDEEDVKPLCYVSKVEVPVETCGEGAVCRACGARGEGTPLWGERRLADMLTTITGVEVEESDGLPDQICTACTKQLEAAYQFRIKCQITDKQQRLARVKQESLPLDDFDFHHDYDDPKLEADDAKVTVKIEKVSVKKNTKVKRPSPKVSKEGPKKKYIYRRVCEICGKSVLNMKEHVIAHTGCHFTCHVCSKSFRYKSGLHIHMKTHSEKTVKDCHICGKSFKMMVSYRRHFAHHADERKFTCETCGKSFNSRDILNVHMRMHTNERPYGCPECGKTFRTTGCVSRHRRIVHKIAALTNKDRSFRLPL